MKIVKKGGLRFGIGAFAVMIAAAGGFLAVRESRAVVQAAEAAEEMDVITAIVTPTPESITLQYKPALESLKDQFPKELQVIVGGMLRDAVGRADGEAIDADGEEMRTVAADWVCEQDYNSQLGEYIFLPEVDGYRFVEGVDVPEIVVTVEEEGGGATGYVDVPLEYEVPIVGVPDRGGMKLLRSSSVYNGKEKGNLPAIRNQGSEGACWAFASIGAVEADLIHDGVYSADEIDLSELQLAYYTSHDYDDPMDCHDDDHAYYQSNASYLSNGGNFTIAYRAMANMVGPISETLAPYTAGSSLIPQTVFGDTVQLKNAYIINISDREAIKNAILEHGGVAASFYAQDSNYNASYNSYYGQVSDTNHGVMLVGWDDSFAATNFNTPAGSNGAWLVRNSWGYEGYGYRGYFWLSYQDAGLLKSEHVVAYDVDRNVYDRCYAYDGAPYPDAYTIYSATYSNGTVADDGTKVTVTQSFPLKGGETLKAVGFETGNANLDVSISVEVNGTTVGGSCHTSYAGYYLVELDNTLVLAEEAQATVSITYTGAEPVHVMFEGTGDTKYGNIIYRASCGSGGFTIANTKLSNTKNNDARMKLFTSVTDNTVKVSGVSLNQTSLTMTEGESATLAATVSPSNATNQSVTWASSDASVASVDGNGRVTAKKAGSATITVTTADGGKTATCAVTVRAKTYAVTGVSLNQTSLSLTEGETAALTATVTPSNATNQSVTWASSDASVASVDGNGKVTAKKAGSATITVTTADGGKTATCAVTVKAKTYAVTGVSLNQTSLSLTEGETAALTATVTPSNATDKSVTWASSDASVASVDGNGKVTAKKAGSATIAVQTADGGKTATCAVTVKAKEAEVRQDNGDTGKGESGNNSGSGDDGKGSIENNGGENTGGRADDGSGTPAAVSPYADNPYYQALDDERKALVPANYADGSGSPMAIEGKDCSWNDVNGKSYWYEGGVKQGTYFDSNAVLGDNEIRGREIYDAASDGWYWLDAIYDGAKAVGKEVWMPYIYQDEDKWDDGRKSDVAYESDEGMGECVLNAIRNKSGKWVRYDENGAMLKGWVTIEGALAELYPQQAGNVYYYDTRTGLMAKGDVTIGGVQYHFDEKTGVRQ